MFWYKVIHRVIHRLCISHNSICKVIMEIKVNRLCKLALQVAFKTKTKWNKIKKIHYFYIVMYSIFKRHSPYKAFIFLLIYLYICSIKFADTIPKNLWIVASLRYREVAELVQLCDTVGKKSKNPLYGKFCKIFSTWKANVCFANGCSMNLCLCERLFL